MGNYKKEWNCETQVAILDERYKTMSEDITTLKEDTKEIKETVSSLKSSLDTLPEKLDGRYASKKYEKVLDKIGMYVILAVIGALLAYFGIK